MRHGLGSILQVRIRESPNKGWMKSFLPPASSDICSSWDWHAWKVSVLFKSTQTEVPNREVPGGLTSENHALRQLNPNKCACKSVTYLPAPSCGQRLVQRAQIISNLQSSNLNKRVLGTGFQTPPQKSPTTCNFAGFANLVWVFNILVQCLD